MSKVEDKPQKIRTPLTSRIVWGLLALFFIIMVVSQVYIYYYNPLRTEVALSYSTTTSILFKGIYIRNEQYVTYDGSGVVAFTHSDGSKLAKNSVVANIYSSQDDIEYQRLIDEKREQIKVLKDAESLVGTDNSQLEAFQNQINENHSQLLEYINAGNFGLATSLKSEYLNLGCKRQIVKSEVVDYTDKIAQLETEIKTLETRISSEPVELRIGEAGYFVSIVDGYETALNYETAAELTTEQIEEIIANPRKTVQNNVIGKIIDDYKWRFIGVMDSAQTMSVFDGATVEIRVGSDSTTISATVVGVHKLLTGKTIFTFESDVLSSDFVESRVAQFRMLLDDYSGIRIPAAAIRFEGEQSGVYVKNGVEVNFRKVNIILTEDDYLLVENTTGQSGYLQLYDNVILCGENLYEGKIII